MDVAVIGGDEFVERALSTTISKPNDQVNYSHGELSFRAVFTIYPFLHAPVDDAPELSRV